MFPIAFMYYFGTNLEERFAIPGFFPTAAQGNRVPKDRDEIMAEIERLRARRLYVRDKRLQDEQQRRGPEDS